jgi:hypothetical protein
MFCVEREREIKNVRKCFRSIKESGKQKKKKKKKKSTYWSVAGADLLASFAYGSHLPLQNILKLTFRYPITEDDQTLAVHIECRFKGGRITKNVRHRMHVLLQ